MGQGQRGRGVQCRGVLLCSGSCVHSQWSTCAWVRAGRSCLAHGLEELCATLPAAAAEELHKQNFGQPSCQLPQQLAQMPQGAAVD